MLYVVSTPIGNMEDMSFRAVRVLGEVDMIAAEDTRRTGRLLSHYGIETPATSYHSHNLKAKTPVLLERLKSGESIALVSDSGTPGISDPGCVLIREAIEAGLPVTHIPGPSALISALLLSGKPTAKFIFEGFLSNKSARRRRALAQLAKEDRTVVLYEAPHRLVAFLRDLLEVAGDREICLARELTKKFEEVRRAPVSEHLEHFTNTKPKGEFVIVI